MKNKIAIVIKIILLIFLAFLWLLFIQAEYEMITKPVLQNDFPVIKGIYAVYFLGAILVLISSLALLLFFSIIKKKKQVQDERAQNQALK